jgi:hypothetical protein
MVANVDVTSSAGRPMPGYLKSSTELAEDKTGLGSERVHRWFKRE